MSSIIYLKTNKGRKFAVNTETNWLGKLKSWTIRDLGSNKENFHDGHPNIKSVKDFNGSKLVYLVQGTSLFVELYGPAASINDIDGSEIIESVSNKLE